MTLTQSGIEYICINFGDTNQCCVSSGLSWYYTRESTDYPETGGTAQIVSRLASGLIDSLTMTSPARGTFAQSQLNNANTQSVTLTDAQTITAHDEPSEDQWCYTLTTGDISFTSTPSGANIYLDEIDQQLTTPTTLTSISPGAHTYRLTLSGHNDCNGSTTVTSGSTSNVHCDMIPISAEVGTLSGQITNTETSLPIPTATITINSYTDTTDTNGYYFIPSIPIGSHNITTSAPAYNTQTDTTYISEGDNYYNTSLSISTAIGDIKGIVLDRLFNPIPSAKATILATNQYDFTDSTGTFVITSVPIGTHTLYITKEGYSTEQLTVDIIEGFNELVSDIILYIKAVSKTTIIVAAAASASALTALGAFLIKRR